MNEYSDRYAGFRLTEGQLRQMRGPSSAERERRKRSQGGADLARMLGNLAPLAGGAIGGLIGSVVPVVGTTAGATIGASLGGLGKVAGDAYADSQEQPIDDEESERERKRQSTFALMQALR